MTTTFYRGSSSPQSGRDLDRSDILAIIEPTLLELLEMARPLPITKLTIKNRLAVLDSDIENSGGELEAISDDLHRALLVAREIPEGYVCALPEPDPSLMPSITRAAGLKPKIVPSTMHLISV